MPPGGHLQDRRLSQLEVMEFDDTQVETFIQNWFSQSDRSKAPAMAKAVKQNESIGKLARNPLMIAIIAVIYEEDKELPQRRVELYKRAVDVLLSRWDKQRQVHNTYKPDQKEFFLKKLALDNHGHGRRVMTEEEVLAVLRRHAAQIGLEEDRAEAFIQEIETRSNLLQEVAHGEYDFLHLSFQEYFTALELRDRLNGMDTIIEHAFDPWWREPLLLYAGLSQDAAPMIKRIEKDVPEDRFYSRLMLMGKCIADALFTETKVKDGVVDRLWELSRKGEYPLLRRLAMEMLSRIKPRRAIDQLVGELSDEDYDVRRRAADALGDIGTVEALPPLIETLKTDEYGSVRERAAYALGRIGAVEALRPLIEAVKTEGDVPVRWFAASALRRIDAVEALSPLLEVMKTDGDVSVRQFAASTLGHIGAAEALPTLIEAMKTDEDGEVRRLAASALGHIGAVEALPTLIEAMKTSKSRSVRGSAAEALGAIGTVEALFPLLQALKTDKDVDVRRRAADALGKIGDETTVPALEQALKDEGEWYGLKVKDAAFEALFEIEKRLKSRRAEEPK
jgi:HEAT repeat protein